MWDHQGEAVAFAMRRPGAILDHGMGGGKTRTAIEIAEAMQAQRILVVCPKSLVGMWPEQFRQWSRRDLETWSGRVMGARGPKKTPRVSERAVAAMGAYKDAIKLGRPFVCVVNYDVIAIKEMAQFTWGTPWDLVIADEVHKIKSHDGKAALQVAKVSHQTRKRGGRFLGLTGTFMPHTEMDVWAQIRAVDSGSRLGTNWHDFCREFGEPETYYKPGGKTGTRYTKIRDAQRDRFGDRLAQVVHRVPQDDLDKALGLEAPVDTFRTCPLSPATRAAYDAMEKDLIAEIPEVNGTAVAANAMVLTNKLAQLSGGFVKDPDGRLLNVCDPPEKAQLLAEVIGDLDPRMPVVVFARFKADLQAIGEVAAKLGRRYGELSGGRRDGVTEGGKLTPGVSVLGVQLQAGGVGIDLTASAVAVFYSLDFRLADYLQSRKRVHRPGQTQRVTYVHLLAEDTIDRAVFGSLRRREDAVTAALTHIHHRRTA
jgi:SNF2 family DNA or RNA helicase